MRYIHYFLVVVLLLVSLAIDAQSDVTVRRKDFKTEKTGFKEAWKHITDGDSYSVSKGIWYSNAFDEYVLANAYNATNAELNYKTGVAALFSDRKDEASAYLIKAFELKNDVAEDILLLTGRSLQFSGKFTDAIEKLNGYLSLTVKKPVEKVTQAKKWIEECNSALIVMNDTMHYEIINAGANINSNNDEYSELISADGKTMYFASRREMPKSSKYYSDSKFDESIFVSQMINGTWGPAISAGKNLSTKYCETPLYLTPSGDKLFIYAGYQNRGDIMVSELKKTQWKAPVKISYNINTRGSETSFAISPSGDEIYWVSDNGKENFGGKDIYFIKKLTEKKWSKPQNAGSVINTVNDEESVRFSAKGDTLWFSSKGHNTIGGFDIFYALKNSLGVWDSVKNLGYPVNTPWDELFYNPSSLIGDGFYFVSNRSGGFGGMDIYKGRLLPPEPKVIPPPVVIKPDTVVVRDTVFVPPPPPVQPVIVPEPVKEIEVFLTGNVTDSETGDPIIAKVDIIDPSTNIVVVTTASSDVDGSYRIKLPERKTYLVDMKATGFLSDMQTIKIQDTSKQIIYKINGKLNKIKVGKKVVLNNILFESGKAVLTIGSYAELDRLWNVLKDSPAMKVEISGHTDKTGVEATNFKLSESRAKTVVDYLVSKGIPQSQMVFRGYGSLQPISDNATPQGRAKNRRVEFKILEF